MALPLPRVIADVGPGGPGVTAMGGMNSLANDMILKKINEIKKQYMPLTTQAEAASKLAYANLMGPQFLAKLLQNPGAIANMGDPAAREALQKAVGAGMGQGNGANTFNQMQQGNMGLGEKAGNSLSNFLTGKLRNIFGSQEQNPQQSQGIPQDNTKGMPQTPMSVNGSPPGGVMREGQQWYDKNGNPVYEQDVQESGKNPLELELTEGQRGPDEDTYAGKTGKYLSTLKRLEKGGEYQAEALKDIGKSQLALSGSGAAQDELIKIIKNPVWQQARDKIPAFQKQQLSLLKVTGSPELRKLAGEYISAAQSMVASQVAGMGNKHLVREYDLAEKQKINDSDTIESSEGKMTNAKNLHDIAVQKNNIIKNLLKQGVDEADAVEIANKKVDVSAIRRATDKLLEHSITDDDIETTAKEMGMTREQVIQRLRAEGRYHG